MVAIHIKKVVIMVGVMLPLILMIILDNHQVVVLLISHCHLDC